MGIPIRRSVLVSGMVLFAMLVAVLGVPGVVQGATFTVTSTADAVDISPGDGVCNDGGGNCTLRAAIMETNALAGADTITIPAGTYTLSIAGAGEDAGTSGDLDVTEELTITGSGVDETIIDGNQLDRVLQVLSSTGVFSLSDLTITNGKVTGTAGGISARGNYNITNCRVTGNEAGSFGGGISTDGVGMIIHSAISGNQSGLDGGGIFLGPGGSLALINSEVSDNVTGGLGGGGIDTASGTVRLFNTIVSGNMTTGPGGGIDLDGIGPRLEAYDSIIHGNTAGSSGGGISSSGSSTTLLFNRSLIGNNTAGSTGGGIHTSDGPVSLVDSTVFNNTANFGGGIFNRSARLSVTRSTVSHNVANTFGGGIDTSGNLTMTNSTVSANFAGVHGGAIHSLLSSSNIALTNSTINDNDAGIEAAGIFKNAATITFKNTIIANRSSAVGSCVLFGTGASLGHNLDDDNSCNLSHPADLPGVDPLLGPLAPNGGPTETHALLPESPALDHGDDSAAPPTDQRGVTRPQGVASDIGAYESVEEVEGVEEVEEHEEHLPRFNGHLEKG